MTRAAAARAEISPPLSPSTDSTPQDDSPHDDQLVRLLTVMAEVLPLLRSLTERCRDTAAGT